jgi:hypothetical protein
MSLPPEMHPRYRVHFWKESPLHGTMSIRPGNSISPNQPLLFGLEVVEKESALLRLLTPVLNNNTRAVDNLACVSLTVQDTYKELVTRTNIGEPRSTHTNQPIHQVAFHPGP